MFNFTSVKCFIVELDEAKLMVFSYPNTTLHVETFIHFLVPPHLANSKNWSNIRKWLPNEDLEGSFLLRTSSSVSPLAAGLIFGKDSF